MKSIRGSVGEMGEAKPGGLPARVSESHCAMVSSISLLGPDIYDECSNGKLANRQRNIGTRWLAPC